MAKKEKATWSGNYLKLNLQVRNQAIRRLVHETRLTPTQISRIYFVDLYGDDNLPVERLEIPRRIAPVGKFPIFILSDELRMYLLMLNLQPFLFVAKKYTRAAFSRGLQGPPLSARQIARIIKMKPGRPGKGQRKNVIEKDRPWREADIGGQVCMAFD